jgi:hypothetical protein
MNPVPQRKNKAMKTHITFAFLYLLSFNSSLFSQNSEESAKSNGNSVWDEPVVEPLNWEYFTAKYDFSAELGNPLEKGAEEVAGTLSIRLRKDSLMWFTVSASIGIQVMKGIIRKDSAFILDNFNKKAYILAIEDLSQINDLPANLTTIQRIFTGELLTNKLLRDQNSDYAKANLESECFTGVESTFKNYMVVLKDQQVSKFQFTEPTRNATLDVYFPVRTISDSGKHPEEISIEAKSDLSKVRLNLSLKTARFEFIPSYPFFIPKDYERVDLKKP